jgi:hypothetical protein
MCDKFPCKSTNGTGVPFSSKPTMAELQVASFCIIRTKVGAVYILFRHRL